MQNPFSLLFKRQDTSVIGIDIGSSSIKVVQLKRKLGKAVLETYGALALGPYGGTEVGRATNLQPDKIKEALADILREANTTTKQCGVALPFKSSLISVLELPTTSEKQFPQMVPLEARKYIPVPISEVTLDWTVIPKEEKDPFAPKDEQTNIIEKSNVLVVAVHNDTINNYKSIVEQASLDVTFFEVELFSTMRSVLDQEIAPVMIFDMGAATTKLYIVERGIVRLSHTINRGAQDVTLALSRSLSIPVDKAESLKRSVGLSVGPQGEKVDEIASFALDFILSEANRVLLGYLKKYNKNIKKIVLVGGGSSLKGFPALAKTAFQTEVVAGDPFGKVETPAFLEEILRTTGPEFTVAVGVALRRLQELE